MKICHLTSVHIPFDTRIFHKECKSLADAGHEVHLIARHEREETVDGIHIHPVPSYPDRLSRMLHAPLAVYRKALEGSYDVCHFHDPELIPVGLLLKAKGMKVVYDAHEDYPVYFRNKEVFPPLLRIPLSFTIGVVERLFAPRFDAVVTVTPTIHARFSRLKCNTFLVCNFPFLADMAPVSGADTRGRDSDAVVYVGSLTLDRGVKEMIGAMGIARSERPVRLLLGGDFGKTKDEEAIRNMPDFEHVDFRGRTTRDETLELFSQAGAGLVLLHPKRNYMDAYPTKLFEYMAAGLPVVASDFPLWREIVDGVGCGYCVDPLNPGAIADAILKLMKDPVEARAMGKRGREAVGRTYNWENEKRKLLALYETLK